MNVADMLERLPTISINEVKVGDMIIMSSLPGSDPTQFTAISLVTGVEPLLTMVAARQQTGGAQGRPHERVHRPPDGPEEQPGCQVEREPRNQEGRTHSIGEDEDDGPPVPQMPHEVLDLRHGQVAPEGERGNDARYEHRQENATLEDGTAASRHRAPLSGHP